MSCLHAQRRKVDREHTDAVPEILAELAVGDHRADVAVRRGDDADVGLERLLAADALEAAVLQHSHQADLSRGGQLGDLVEQQRAAVGPLEPPAARVHGPGETAALVTEELGVDELRRDRTTVHPQKWPAAPTRQRMHGARDDLLARAGLAEDRYRRLGRRHLLDLIHHAAQTAVAADDRLGEILAL